MPFIPHTPDDTKVMLDVIGVKQLENLFDEIPKNLRCATLTALPKGVSEMTLNRLMRERAAKDAGMKCFIGAGAYDHHIPAAVWDIATRGEFMTAYTPYQPEASQGTLQLLYEYQTMMASLMGLDVSNASLYDGASALAEAVLMAVRVHRKNSSHRILLPTTLHPHCREVVKAIVGQHSVEINEIPYDLTTGRINVKDLSIDTATALIIPQPNFFGVLEEIDELTDWAHQHGALAIAVVNPLAMALLKPPGQWGKAGADIACGEGQSLGIPLSSGGPYYGFLCCKKELVRQLPGRIVGQTVDTHGNLGFVLTLQAREQHIRRAKATSNICTNQGLMVTATTIYMSLVGPHGLKKIAAVCHQNLMLLRRKILALKNVKLAFPAAVCFHEMVLVLPVPVDDALHRLAKQHIQAGFSLKKAYPELGECLLVCVTETKTEEDLNLFVHELYQATQKMCKVD